MSSEVRLERRAAQRFDFHLAVSVRLGGDEREGCGFTQNLSARGALFHTNLRLSEMDAIALTLVMPSEITLAKNMRVRCRGKVLRVISCAGANDPWSPFTWRDTNSCPTPQVDRPGSSASQLCTNVLMEAKAERGRRHAGGVLLDPEARHGSWHSLQSVVFCVEWVRTLPHSAGFRRCVVH
jgi:hypothetical protein